MAATSVGQVDFSETISLFDLADLKIQLQDHLGLDVDLVLKNNIKPALAPFINADLIKVYEQN